MRFFSIILTISFLFISPEINAEEGLKDAILSYHLSTREFKREVNELSDIRILAYKNTVELVVSYDGKEDVKNTKQLPNGWEKMLTDLPVQGNGKIRIKNSFAVNDDIQFLIKEEFIFFVEGNNLHITSIDGHLTSESAGVLSEIRRVMLNTINSLSGPPEKNDLNVAVLINKQIKRDEDYIKELREAKQTTEEK